MSGATTNRNNAVRRFASLTYEAMLLVTNPKIRSMILTPFLTPITSDTIDGVITAFLEHRRNWVIVNEVTGDQNPKPPAEV